jgi:hypothetical protein
MKAKPSDSHSPVAPQAPIAPKIVYRSTKQFRHDLFKALACTYFKNTSWRKGVVQLDPIEHAHHFHSHNQYGMAQEYTNSVGGHFHKVEVQVAADGTLVAVCGKPLRKIQRRLRNGTVKTEIVEVAFFDDEKGTIKDDHTHTMTYMGSDMLSPMQYRPPVMSEPVGAQGAQYEDSTVKLEEM